MSGQMDGTYRFSKDLAVLDITSDFALSGKDFVMPALNIGTFYCVGYIDLCFLTEPAVLTVSYFDHLSVP